MRNAFIKELTEIAGKNKKVILLTGDLGFTVFEDFAHKYPDRFFNMGAAEANMLGVATKQFLFDCCADQRHKRNCRYGEYIFRKDH